MKIKIIFKDETEIFGEFVRIDFGIWKPRRKPELTLTIEDRETITNIRMEEVKFICEDKT